MTPEKIAELEALAEKATPGPWGIYAQTIAASTPERKADSAKAEMLLQVEMTTEMVDHIYLLWAGDKCPATTGCGPTSAANADLIVALVNNLPAILSALKAQQPGEDVVERVARALCAADPEVRHGDAEGVVQQRVHIEWHQYAHAARAAIAAMQESRDD